MRDYIYKLASKPLAIPTTVGIVGVVGGFSVGYILGKRKRSQHLVTTEMGSGQELDLTEYLPEVKLRVEEQERLLQERLGYIADTKEDEDETEEVLTVVSPLSPDPTKIVVSHQPNEEKLKGINYNKGAQPESEESIHMIQPEIQNVFANNEDDGWNYEAECSTRTKDRPYIVHVDEFMSNELNSDQATFTYYQGDDILVDERDVPVYNYAEAMGELKFGHGSKDKNCVYIRNERLDMEYEILLHTGSYEVEVLGYQTEQEMEKKDLKHSSLKFRPD